LQRQFYIEAVKYDVLPLDNSKVERLDVNNRPSNIRGVSEFTYYDGMVRIPEGSAPDLKNKSFGISAVVEIPEGGAEGMLMTQGGRFAGVGLYILLRLKLEKVTINITDEPLTEKQLKKYREGRAKAALAQ
jgi:arylsulfatase